ncbi:hypothetical protein RM844_24955 [Streptomyces sp. DSM 44915]|uniref:Uncharacterized protein n=1 Tax=Streptomyces chisholmiae TaxID=3075540 RepID=A0ABU2JX15_9ACTN|nr:hypothetical protein [Streptomyces sp. DSM 44915]MDT0269536.1 hypothetical protein [Streptomyces sp. DSM 44915]
MAHLTGWLCPSAARVGWRDVAPGPVNRTGGCLHPLDAEGRSLACLAVSDWLPGGGWPVPLELADAVPAPVGGVAADGYLARSGLADFLGRHDLPVHELEEGQEPPRAPGFLGTLRPGPRNGGTVWIVPAVALLLAVLFSWVPNNAAARNAMASAPFLVLALVNVVPAVVLGLSGLRAGRTTAVAELRPSPGVPVTRAFLRRSVLRLTADAFELRTAQRQMRLIQHPDDPVLGIREAVVLQDAGQPWGVAFLDDRRTVLVFLHWDTWFAGDSGRSRLAAFCQSAGIGLREERMAAFPARRDEDRTARPWRAGAYMQNDLFAYASYAVVPLVGTVFPLFFGLFVWDLAWDPFFPVIGAALAIGVVPYAIRGAYRKWWLNQLVEPAVAGAGAMLDKREGTAS